ncbi:MAG TPA: ATP-binding cassette domain-containing protein [Salinivirgaceae bacterium]|nr:ATP-binding cassette domain-containing protein [Salinivirgaceae bacterium]
MSLLKIENINTGYDKKQVLFDISLQISQGETVLLVGGNGSGKSTLLKAIYGLLPLWSGNIYYDNELIQTSNSKINTPRYSALISRHLVYIPQKNELFADMSVAENLRMSLLHLNDKHETESRVTKLMDEIPILKNRYRQTADRLSGGEAKLLSLGMAMVNRPKLLLYDEPLSGLSGKNISIVLKYIEQLKRSGTTLVLVEHKIKELFEYADRIIGLKLGYLHTENLDTLDNIKTFMI